MRRADNCVDAWLAWVLFQFSLRLFNADSWPGRRSRWNRWRKLIGGFVWYKNFAVRSHFSRLYRFQWGINFLVWDIQVSVLRRARLEGSVWVILCSFTEIESLTKGSFVSCLYITWVQYDKNWKAVDFFFFLRFGWSLCYYCGSKPFIPNKVGPTKAYFLVCNKCDICSS